MDSTVALPSLALHTHTHTHTERSHIQQSEVTASSAGGGQPLDSFLKISCSRSTQDNRKAVILQLSPLSTPPFWASIPLCAERKALFIPISLLICLLRVFAQRQISEISDSFQQAVKLNLSERARARACVQALSSQ